MPTVLGGGECRIPQPWCSYLCLNFSTPGEAIVFTACLNEVDSVCLNGRAAKEDFSRGSNKIPGIIIRTDLQIFRKCRAQPPSE